MKHLILFSIIMFSFGNISTGQINNTSQKSNIFFITPPYLSIYPIKMKIRINDIPIIRLGNSTFYKHAIESGTYSISCKMEKNAEIDLKVANGKNYYIVAYLVRGFWSTSPILEEIDSATAMTMMKNTYMTELNYEPLPLKNPTTRFGIQYGFGGGLEKVIMGQTEEGDDVTLSTGGGFNIGIEYGHEFNKHFDLSINSFFQVSELNPNVENASATFKRFGILITPSVIMPVNGGHFMRFRLGVGPGYYLYNKLKISTSPVIGTENILRYKPNLGLHGSFIFESNISDNSSAFVGLKYTYLKHAYTEKGSNTLTSEPKLQNPDGSGIDLIMGFFYRF